MTGWIVVESGYLVPTLSLGDIVVTMVYAFGATSEGRGAALDARAAAVAKAMAEA